MKQPFAILLFLIVAIASRLIPHPPNMTAMSALIVLSHAQLSSLRNVWLVLLTLWISDALLTLTAGYPLWGSWSVFTYSGFALLALIAPRLIGHTIMRCWQLSFIYWIWTNWGVWLTSSLYPQNPIGLLNCYVQALPFLRNALLGDLLWCSITLAALTTAPIGQRKPKILTRQL